MLDGAYKFKKVFARMFEENEAFKEYFEEEVGKNVIGEKITRVGPPDEVDWEDSIAFTLFLKKFFDTTLLFSASNYCTSHLIFKELVNLQREIEDLTKDYSKPTLQKVALSMKLKFDKYWTNFGEMNKLIYVPNVLDPRFKFHLIESNYKKLGRPINEIKDIVYEVKKCMYDLYEEYKGDAPMVGGGGGYNVMAMHVDVGRVQDRQLRELQEERQEDHLLVVSNEVDCYLSDPYENAMNLSFNLMDWWRGNQSKYPILSKIAKDIFAIPTSTVASENAFSLGGRIVDPFRASLTPKMVEALVCTSDWLRADDFHFYKEPT